MLDLQAPGPCAILPSVTSLKTSHHAATDVPGTAG